MWNCLCECGNELVVRGGALKNGNTKSCGCLQKECATSSGKKNKTHGLSKTSLYHVLFNARDRVTNPDNPAWKDYGGRGIEMCDTWLYSTESFLKDMGPTWQYGLTLEREDTDGNYCPENCKWATEGEQNHNKRKLAGCSSQYKGVSFNKKAGKFIASIKIRGKQIYLGSFIDEFKAALAYDNCSEEFYGDRPNQTVRQQKGETDD